MSARTVAPLALAAVAVVAPLALVSPAAATVGAMSPDPSLSITDSGGMLARAVWHESGDILCVHAGRREAQARFRTAGGRVVSVADFAGGSYWTCTPNLNVPEDDRVRLSLRWKYLGVDHYARSTSRRITT